MPDVTPEDYSHLLDRQQRAASESAAQAGRPFDERSQALTNLVKRFEDPHQALSYLSEVADPLKQRREQLNAITAGGNTLSQTEKDELARINNQLSGTASIGGDVVNEITQAKAQRLEEYRAQGTQSLDGLRGTVESLRVASESADRELNNARRIYRTAADKAEKLRPFEDAVRMSEARYKEAEGVFTDMNRTAAERNAREAAKTEKEQAVGRKRQLRGMSLDELGGTVGDLQDDRDRKQKELDDATAAGASDEDKGRIQKELADLTARFNEANDVLSRKKVETAGEIDADLAKQAEALTRERSSIADLTTRIGAREAGIQTIRQDIENLRNELNDPALADNERKEKSDRLYELTKRLRAEEDTLKLDRGQVSILEEREQAESKAFKDKDSQGRADELFNLSQDLDISKYPINSINNRLLYGGDVTREELAAWARETSDTVIDRGRGGVNMQELHRIFAQRPELRIAFAKRITEDEETQKFLREKFPNSWERIIDFAKKNPAWLMILLAIIVGTAGAAGAVVGPAAGIALGAGGAGGGAFGVSRRNW